MFWENGNGRSVLQSIVYYCNDTWHGAKNGKRNFFIMKPNLPFSCAPLNTGISLVTAVTMVESCDCLSFHTFFFYRIYGAVATNNRCPSQTGNWRGDWPRRDFRYDNRRETPDVHCDNGLPRQRDNYAGNNTLNRKKHSVSSYWH